MAENLNYIKMKSSLINNDGGSPESIVKKISERGLKTHVDGLYLLYRVNVTVQKIHECAVVGL